MSYQQDSSGGPLLGQCPACGMYHHGIRCPQPVYYDPSIPTYISRIEAKLDEILRLLSEDS